MQTLLAILCTTLVPHDFIATDEVECAELNSYYEIQTDENDWKRRKHVLDQILFRHWDGKTHSIAKFVLAKHIVAVVPNGEPET